MTIPRMNELASYWKSHPPTHIAVQRGLGVVGEAKASKPVPAERESQLGELISMFQGGALRV
jgi:hypothetical protein